jgi:hypothetical protein
MIISSGALLTVPTKMSLLRIGVVLLVAVLGVSYWIGRQHSTGAGGATTGPTAQGAPSTPASHAGHDTSAKPISLAPLAAGQRWIDLTMPGGTYTPQAPAGGTDDYRCILLDPHLTANTFLSSVAFLPGNGKLVHHAILYRIEPAQLSAAQKLDGSDPRLGWSCFGGPGLPSIENPIAGLDSAPWVAAFATAGGEQRFAAGTGQRLAAGSRLILQIHYNLLDGGGTDNSAIKLRVAAPTAKLQPLQTLLLPGPVELPCAPTESGPLCDRTAAVFDVVRRFGNNEGRIIAALQLLCGGNFVNPTSGPTQSCSRPVPRTMQLRAVAGHMHMLGRSIQIDLIRADGASQRLLDIKVWNFDDQRATVLGTPVTVGPTDTLKVTCTHDASLRQKIPSLSKLQPRYVVWGEGSSDEMCLGIVAYTLH